jgi:WD40 repeat protein
MVMFNTTAPLRPRRLYGIMHVLAVAPDGRLVAGADRSGRLVVGVPASPAPPRPLSLGATDAGVAAAVFTRNGRELLSYHQNGVIARWRLTGLFRGSTVLDTLMTANIKYPDQPVGDAQFSEDGRRLAVAFWGEMPRVWDVKDGGAVLNSAGTAEYLLNVNLSRDGSRLVTYYVSVGDVREADTVRLTNISHRAWEQRACSILSVPAKTPRDARTALERLCARARAGLH